MKKLFLLALLVSLISCTNRLVVRDIETGQLEEVYPDGHDDYLNIGDTILVQCGIRDIPTVYATGKYIIPESRFGKYISVSGDTTDYVVYYKQVEILDKVVR